jgi:hypothetical protein
MLVVEEDQHLLEIVEVKVDQVEEDQGLQMVEE